jgi:tetratricopeptide (TPR) repeat protein
MKKLLLVFLFFPFCLLAQRQNYIDSLKQVLNNGTTDSARFMNLYWLSITYAENDPDSAIHYAQEAYQFASRNKEKLLPWMEWNSSNALGWALWSAGNYPDAQSYYFQQLAQAQAIKDTFGIYQAYGNLGTLNRNEGNFKAAISYYKKCLSYYHEQGVVWWQATVFPKVADMAKAYEQTDVLDSALLYAQQAMQMQLQFSPKQTAFEAATVLGTIYSKMGQSALAMGYFNSFLNGVGNDPVAIKDKALCLYEIAKHFERNKQYDSAVLYAQKAYQVNEKHSFKINSLNISSLLSQLYQLTHQTDSALKYLNIKDQTQDDLFSKEKLSRMQTLDFTEQLRQKQMEITEQHEKEERSHNLQLIILAISIISAIIVFLLVSRSIIVSHKLVSFLNVVALLVVFEFINLLVHPFLERVTHHSPVLLLLVLVCIAALLVPIHHKLEKWASATLVEKNKQLRLAAAKKIIEQLEGEPSGDGGEL